MTLDTLRRAVEVLADDDGGYRLVCARHGGEPVPATGLRFESRATARVAVRVVEQYRQHLREYDPAVPVYDVVVAQAGDHRYRARQDEQPAPTENRQQFSQSHD